MANNVQRRGLESVLQGYDMQAEKSPVCSLWCQRELLFYTDDRDCLEQNLQAIKQAGSDSLYTLRFHSAMEKDGVIKNSTPYTGSFSFKVTEMSNQAVPYNNGGGSTKSSISNLVNDLDALERLQDYFDKRSALAGVGSVDETFVERTVGELLNKEPVAEGIGKLITNLADFIPQIAGLFMNKNRISLAGVPVDEETARAQINEAIARLLKCDPLLGEHLLKLADLAEKQPGKYQMALQFL